ncbi:efflux RND transporter periplasmic adaptor subunit [Ferrimonas kyonanensis]|uniref:efflux RND transporter periplasmic adaptor subunit n=1 Tax=Ferrimonas kyonanensis TaxID=364763 RepID=UPI00040E1FEF|nr:efflux RND transporter periplasmic adaptor subunit [Ferrimonas kyonanensis]
MNRLIKPVFAAALLGSIVLAMTTSAVAKGAGDKPQLVELFEVVNEPWGDRLEGVGTVYARNHIEVISQTEGVIRSVDVGDGRVVKKGQSLIQLDPSYPQAILAEAQAQLQDDERRLAELSQLSRSNAVSESSLLEQQAKVAMSKARVDAAQVSLSYYSIKAPFDGVLGLSQLSQGQYIQRGEALLNLTDLNSLYVDFGLPSRYLSLVQVGQLANLHFDAWPDREFTATISSIDPVIDTQSRNLRVRTELDNPQQMLRPGLLVQIHVQLASSPSVVVPTSAIFYRGTEAFVYQVKPDNLAHSVAIEVGSSRGTLTQVLQGLAPGARVVSAGVGKLTDGSPVAVADDQEQQP